VAGLIKKEKEVAGLIKKEKEVAGLIKNRIGIRTDSE
jgi:hypothetical protein